MSHRMSIEAREEYLERRSNEREQGCIRRTDRQNAYAAKGVTSPRPTW